MAKKVICILTTFILVVGLVIGSTQQSFAYTDEEKAQAKAWLSAHGYSPDAGGANQAYEDYLNGKFDDELGLNTQQYDTGTYEINTDAATAEQNMQPTTEKTTEVADDEENDDEDLDDKTKSKGSNNQDIDNAQGGAKEEVITEDTQQEINSRKETISESNNAMVENETAVVMGSAKNKNEISEMEQANRDEKNRAAVRVICGSTVIMIIAQGYVTVFRRRKRR